MKTFSEIKADLQAHLKRTTIDLPGLDPHNPRSNEGNLQIDLEGFSIEYEYALDFQVKRTVGGSDEYDRKEIVTEVIKNSANVQIVRVFDDNIDPLRLHREQIKELEEIINQAIIDQ